MTIIPLTFKYYSCICLRPYGSFLRITLYSVSWQCYMTQGFGHRCNVISIYIVCIFRFANYILVHFTVNALSFIIYVCFNIVYIYYSFRQCCHSS